jgi:S-adenosylmethionine hydrolase
MQLITLTSDFGYKSQVLPSVKATIYATVNDVQIVDVVHEFQPFNLQQAVYVFKQTYLHFPENSIHFIYNDLYANSNQQLLYVYENGQHIFCPDNGLITMLFNDKPIQVFKLNEQISNGYNYLTVTKMYCDTLQTILNGSKKFIDVVSVVDIMVKQPMEAHYENNILEAQVLYIDQFENVILNVTQAQFEEARQGRIFKILIMRDEEINELHSGYGDVMPGDKVAFFNATNFLEIAINRGNAASLFGFSLHNEKSLFYNHIKIFFE